MATSLTSHRPLPRWQRSLLPAMLGADRADRGASGGSELPRSLRDWFVDVVIFLGAVAIGGAALVSDHRTSGTALFAVDVLLGIPALGLLWVRRRHPLLVGAYAIGVSSVSGLAGGAALAALFTVAIYCPPRRTAELTVLSLATTGVYSALYTSADGHYNLSALFFGIAGTVIAVMFGSFVRVRRELVFSLRERNRQLVDDQHRHVEEARRAERNRIAREMHDVLAHRISLLAVHGGALEFHPDAPPEEIARAATVIRESARAAQEELRAVIGVLRADPDEEVVEPPQPTLDDVAALVRESRHAGMEVELSSALEPGSLPPTLGRTVYRLVQEALTNVRKHAPGDVVAITIAGARRGGLRVAVTNQPPVGRAPAGRRDAPAGGAQTAPRDAHVGSGTGLIGLAERVALAGGRLEHGPLPGGGFRVAATLPWSREP